MKNSIIAACLSMGFLTPYAGAAVNFDQGVDVKAAITEALKTDLILPDVDKYPGQVRYTRDCVRLSFGPSDTGILSEKVWLQSTEYVTECYNTGNPPAQNCYERPGQTWRETVQLNIKPRKLFPWENETFDACLEGPWSDLYADETGYKYAVKAIGNYDTLFELTPQNKIAMRADKNGINFGEFSYAGGKYSFKVNDVWAKEYAGEKVAIKVELFKDNPNWFDSSKGEKEFTFDAAPGYEMSFAESDLVPPGTGGNNNNFNGGGVKGGPQQMYLKWGFTRLGVISKADFVKKDETPRVEVN